MYNSVESVDKSGCLSTMMISSVETVDKYVTLISYTFENVLHFLLHQIWTAPRVLLKKLLNVTHVTQKNKLMCMRRYFLHLQKMGITHFPEVALRFSTCGLRCSRSFGLRPPSNPYRSAIFCLNFWHNLLIFNNKLPLSRFAEESKYQPP